MDKDPKTREIEDEQLAIGLDFQQFIISGSGKYFMDLLEQLKALTCAEALLGKFETDRHKEKKGEYICQNLEDFYLQRGFALGIQEVIYKINEHINVAKRIRREREKEKEKLDK